MSSTRTTATDDAGAGGSRRRASRRRTRPLERAAVSFVIAVAATGGAFASGRPCGVLVLDVAFRAGLAGVTTLAGSRSRRLPLLVMSGIAATAADGAVIVGIAAAAVVLGFLSAVTDHRGRLVGALIAGGAVNVLLRLPTSGRMGISALLAAAGALPVLLSGYRNASRKQRARARVAAWIAGITAALLAALFTVVLLDARAQAERGIADARAGLTAIRLGEQDTGIARLQGAGRAFAEAHRAAGTWWALPARALPVLGHQLRAVAVVSDAGSRLADVAAEAARSADPRTISVKGGKVDLALIRSFDQPLTDVVSALDAAQARISGVRSPWLLSPIQDRIRSLTADIDTALPDARNALQIVQVAPALLGADGPRHYFIAFITPAELRGLGGFMGDYGELTAVDGKVSLTQSGRTDDLRPRNDAPDLEITGPPDYVRRYLGARPGHYVQDIPFSPDFPTVAHVFEEVYPQTPVGRPVDGVIALDPFALAALLKYTGPVHLEGLDQPLTTRNAAEFLLKGQYTEFSERADRVDFLDEATRVVFDELTNSDLPDPRKVARDLGPLVAQGRIMAHSTRADEQAVFQRVGLANAFPAVDGGDFLGVIASNSGNNKIDIFLDRQVSYEATYDPSTGQVDGTVTVVLHNRAPASGLPDYVIGNRDGLPLGTNHLFLSIYSPFTATDYTVDGSPVPFSALPELDRRVYSAEIAIPPGGTATATVHLEGALAPSSSYRLTVAHQPTIAPDRLAVTITPAGGARFGSGEGFEIGGGLAEATLVQETDLVLTARLR